MILNGSQILMECLLEQNVDVIFGYPGGSVLNIYDQLYYYKDKITHILTSHEQAAAHAADGYARSTGKIGVCLATSGPGATNLVTGIATAYMDSVPIVCITGNVNTSLLGKDSFQEVDITGLTMSITKHNYIVKNVEDLADIVREAFFIAGSGRPGPVLIDIPKNVSAETTEFIKKPLKEMSHGRKISQDELLKLKKYIDSAKKPFVLVGGGAVRSGASDEVIKFAKTLKAPVSATFMGIGAYPAADEQYLGMIGMHGTKASNIAASKCDLFITLGARMNDRVIGNPNTFAKNAKFIHIDIDEAEINKNIKSHHHVIGDIKIILSQINEVMENNYSDEFLKEIQQYVIKSDIGNELIPKNIMAEIYNITKGEAIVATEVGQHQMWVGQHYPFSKPNQLISSGGFGTMGYGLGAAIGCAIGNKDKKIVHIAGDGCFRMNCNELAVVDYYKLPITTVIVNNSTLGMVRQWQQKLYGGRISQTTLDRGPDFVKLAESYGIKAKRVFSMEDFKKAFTEFYNDNEPGIIDLKIDIDALVTPMVAPGSSITEFLLD